MPERERKVAKRLREIRKETGLSMVAFADAIGLDSGRYSRYEYGYVPLPYTVGDKICSHFDIPQQRVVGVEGSFGHYIQPSPELQKAIGDRATFLEAYDGFLKERIAAFLSSIGKQPNGIRWVEEKARGNASTAFEMEEMRKELLTIISDALQNCPDTHQRIELHDELCAVLEKFAAANPGVVNFKIPKIISVTIRRAKK